MEYYSCIRKVIEKQVLLGRKEFILYPFGEQGMLTKRILNEVFGIQEKGIIDNYLSKFNCNIKDLSCLLEKEYSNSVILITSDNVAIWDEIRINVERYVSPNRIIDIFENKDLKPRVGKYSYGPLCDNSHVESIGAFCSFGPLTDVVWNHAISYISTHPFLYYKADSGLSTGSSREKWYFEGIEPKGNAHKKRKVKIGNDVWLGRNVIITNGSNIGNGVIAGAGAVITKDIPDYSVVVGVPARIIRFRYSQEQIRELNKIAWWDWTDEKIRRCYNDFFDSIENFINKHKVHWGGC